MSIYSKFAPTKYKGSENTSSPFELGGRGVVSLSSTLIIIFCLFSFVGCSSNLVKAGGTQEGLASFYGKEFNGRKTSSGEQFDMNALTAAHRTYPFGTVVRITNLKNGKEIEVKINDRGPVKPERIIDLSYAAAKAIDLDRMGLARVRLEVLEWGESLR